MNDYVLHTFRPGETIDAIIKLKCQQAYALTPGPSEMVDLRTTFKMLNGDKVPVAGSTCKIPLP